MNELMKDIIHTADSFVKNFTDNPIYPSIEIQPFDYSIESLEAVDKLLEESAIIPWMKMPCTILHLWSDATSSRQRGETMVENISG